MNKILNYGVKPSHEPWEIFFVRKMNLIALIGGFNVLTSYFLFPLIGMHQFQTVLLAMVIISPFVFLANKYLNYITAAYVFFIPGAGLMYMLTVGMGIESYVVLFFFPLILSIVHLMGRKETFVHMLILLGTYLICILFIGFAFQNGEALVDFTDAHFKTMRIYIMILAMFTSIAFFAIVTSESIRQEELIKKMLREKEVLLAEVYHRVKNNMSIVTSLLNLKKNVSDSEEVKEALESCRARVYSMSLVHEKFLIQNSLTKIDFTTYAKDLIDAISHSYMGIREAEVEISADELYLEVSQAIPCGLILNELLTNSFKHAKTNGNVLRIKVDILNQGKQAEIILNDNGTLFVPDAPVKDGSMGIELVHSLCEQLDATCGYKNEKGSHFSIRFDIINH